MKLNQSNSEKALQRPWIRVFVLILFCLFVACIIIPPIIWIFHAVGYERYSVAKIARRVFMIALLMGFAFQFRSLSLPAPTQAGYVLHSGALKNLILGIVIGFISLLGISILQLYAGYRYYCNDNTLTDWLWRLTYSALAATLIACLEEYIFRGVLLRALRQRFRVAPAIIISSLIFGSLHFFTGKSSAVYDYASVRWFHGFLAARDSIVGMIGELDPIAFTGIFLVGLVLCIATTRTGSLYLSTGLHFGWVYYIKTLGRTFNYTEARNSLFGGGQVYDGLVGPIGLLLLIPVILILIRRNILIKYRVQ